MPEANCRDAALSNDFYDFLISPDYFAQYAYNPGYCTQRIGRTAGCVYLPQADFPNLSLAASYYTSNPKLYGLMEGTSTQEIRSIALQQEQILNLDGEGVFIGFIGTGINYTSDYFKTSTNTTRIVGIWDQTIQTGSPPPDISYGSVYTEEMINEALAADDPLSIVPSIDTHGNGTYLASVAAASENESGSFRGVAPRASIGVVKLKEAKPYLKDFYAVREDAVAYQENDIMLAIRYFLELSSSLSMPLVICLGVGTNIGSHNDSSLLAQYIDEISTGARCVVCGTGNEADKRHHYTGRFEPDQEYIDVEVRTQNNSRGFWMELWGKSPDVYTISVISPSGETLPRIPYRIGTSTDYRFIFEGSTVTITYQIVGQDIGSPVITIRLDNLSDGIWTFRVFPASAIYGQFQMWLPINEFITGETYFLTSNPEMTLTEPSTSVRSITTSAYDSGNNSIFLESGRGFTFTGNIKPFFASPGVGIPGINLRDAIVRFSGTGGSAALAAGACAIIFQWANVLGNDTNLGFIRLSTLLIRGAERTPTRTFPNREWGYGTLDLPNTFENLRPI